MPYYHMESHRLLNNQTVGIIPTEQTDLGLHSHSFTELVLVSSGTGIHVTKNHEFELNRHNIFVIKEGQSHGYRNCKNLQIINLLFHLKELHQQNPDLTSLPGYHALFYLETAMRLGNLQQEHIMLSTEQWTVITGKIDLLNRELEAKKPGFKVLSKALLIEIITLCSRYYMDSDSPLHRVGQLAELFSWLEEHYNEKIYTHELTGIANMSLSALQRQFKEITGLRIVDYINRIRIDRAAELLRTNNRAIYEIAYSVGFEDSNYFSRLFKKEKGLSPRTWRKRP
ncbi:MAG: helix-turn-helix domain-containing protein [Lentisphaeria bacterium]|nr:helix-turn-helix domain-containing protein [Lentisphaeria bacterium]